MAVFFLPLALYTGGTMSSADAQQLRHNVPAALKIRLEALRNGSEDWHEWHQAGVLVSQLGQSAWLQFGVNADSSGMINDLFAYAYWLFDQATRFVPPTDAIAPQAIECDWVMAKFFKLYTLKYYAAANATRALEPVIWSLNELPLSPARIHQLLIAQGFAARMAWWMALADPDNFLVSEEAARHEAIAEEIFHQHAGVSPDRGRAYCSHLVAMALIHSQLETARWRRTYLWPAFRLAMSQGDAKQVARVIMIARYGLNGEVRLRARRDTLDVFSSTLRELRALRNAA
jgi:hypothetical protein